MIILSNRYYGNICRCNNCGCLIGYKPEDLHAGHYVYCPQCKFEIWVPLDLTYDGTIIEEKEHENVEPTVSEQPESKESNSRSEQ